MKRRVLRDEPFEVKRRDTSREWLEARFAALPELDVRRLFSGAGLYSADVIFAIYYHGRVYFKVDESTAGDFLSRGSEPFCPRPGQTLGRYYEVPPEVVDDDDDLLAWARRAVVAAQSSSPQPQRQSKRRRAPRKATAKGPRAGSVRGGGPGRVGSEPAAKKASRSVRKKRSG